MTPDLSLNGYLERIGWRWAYRVGGEIGSIYVPDSHRIVVL